MPARQSARYVTPGYLNRSGPGRVGIRTDQEYTRETAILYAWKSNQRPPAREKKNVATCSRGRTFIPPITEKLQELPEVLQVLPLVDCGHNQLDIR